MFRKVSPADIISPVNGRERIFSKQLWTYCIWFYPRCAPKTAPTVFGDVLKPLVPWNFTSK